MSKNITVLSVLLSLAVAGGEASVSEVSSEISLDTRRAVRSHTTEETISTLSRDDGWSEFVLLNTKKIVGTLLILR